MQKISHTQNTHTQLKLSHLTDFNLIFKLKYIKIYEGLIFSFEASPVFPNNLVL